MTNKSNKPKNKPNPQKRCLFCNGIPATKEHFFSDWISKVVPRVGKMRQQTLSTTVPGLAGPIIIPSKRLTKQGSLLSKRLRVVCKPCNSRWMADIENAAISVMTPLLRGERVTLTPKAQAIIATWTTLKTSIGERGDPAFASVSPDEIEEFYHTKRPLTGWKIWIGHYIGTKWSMDTHYMHSGGPFSVDATTQGGIIYTNRGKRQTSSFTIGQLYIYVFSSTIPAIYELRAEDSTLLHYVLPATDADISWPPALNIDDDAAWRIAYSLSRFIR